MKVCRMREFILTGACLLSIWICYPVMAQDDTPSPRDWRRVERQVERLSEDRADTALSLEKRLQAIEWQQKQIGSQIETVTKLVLGIMTSVIGLIIQALWGLIVGRRNAQAKE